jgi:hypothetical protein
MLDPNNRTFAGKLDAATQDVARYAPNDGSGHATFVASIAAGNSLSDHLGIAFGSTIIGLDVGGGPLGQAQSAAVPRAVAQAIDIAVRNGARVINLSIGFGGEYLPPEMPEIIAAAKRAADAGVVIVVVASNEPGGARPFATARALADQASSGNVIIAGGYDLREENVFNRAGTYTQYLTALAVGVRHIDVNGRLAQGNGTSAAAPIISGAVALLASAFPHLTGQQIVKILLDSAQDKGEPGFDAIWGNGILDLERAFQPMGATKMAGSQAPVSITRNGQGSGAMGDASGQIGGAIILDGFSRAYTIDLARTLSRAPQEQPLAQGIGSGEYSTAAGRVRGVLVSITTRRNLEDQLETYLGHIDLTHEDKRKAKAVAGMALSRLTSSTAVALGLSESGRTLQQRLSGGYGHAFLVARDPMIRMGFQADAGLSVGLRHDLGPVGLTITTERGEVRNPDLRQVSVQPGYSIGSLSADTRVGPITLTVGASRLYEEVTVLGGRFSEAFSRRGSTTQFLDGTASLPLGRGLAALASYRHGWTNMPGTGSLVDQGRLSTEAFAFDISRVNAFALGDKLAVRMMQPLRVRSGGLDLNLPVSYDHATGDVGYESRFFNLAPSGREVDYELAYNVGFLRGDLAINAFLRTDPGHVEAMKKDVGAAVKFTLGF